MRISDWSSDVCSSDLHFYARMTATGKELTGANLALHPTYDAPPYPNADAFLGDLRIVAESLANHRCGLIGQLRLGYLVQAVSVFGLHLATLDLRQSSDVHDRVLTALFKAAGVHQAGQTGRASGRESVCQSV